MDSGLQEWKPPREVRASLRTAKEEGQGGWGVALVRREESREGKTTSWVGAGAAVSCRPHCCVSLMCVWKAGGMAEDP